MSFIRRGQETEWEEDVENNLYVYSDGQRIVNLPNEKKPFIEVVMRMLDQEGSLDDETLEEVHDAFRERLWLEEEKENQLKDNNVRKVTLMGTDGEIAEQEVEFEYHNGTWRNIREVVYGPVDDTLTCNGLIISSITSVIPLHRQVTVTEGEYIFFEAGAIEYE